MNPVRIHEGRGHSWQNYLCDTVQCFYEEMDSLQLLTLYLALTLTPIFSGRKAKINLHTTPKLTVVIPICCLLPCADPGIFVRGWGGGGPRQSDKKSSDSVVCLFLFFAFFLVLGLFYRSQMVNFKEKNQFSKFRRGSKFFQGVQIFPGGRGSNCLFPTETQITCDFPGGGSGPPALRIRTWLRSIKFPSPQNDVIASCTCACFRVVSSLVVPWSIPLRMSTGQKKQK